MIVGYVCESDPFVDRKNWSGTIFKIREAIEMAGFEVVWVPFSDDTKFVGLSKRLRWRLYKWLGSKQILGGVHFLPEVFAYAKSIKKDDNFEKCDVLFFPRGGQIGCFLRTTKPIIYYSDATAFVMNGYYWKNCLQASVKMACWLEKKAAQKALVNIRSSKWAADSVVKDCKCSSDNVYVLEFGANIDSSDIIPITPYKSGRLNVLFSGVDWDRKGGDVAVETVRLLREKGIDSYLHIVGIVDLPEYCNANGFIINYGFLDKNNPDSYREYINVLKKCHIMLLPTKSECSAIVYCEAAGFGLPTYTYATGGVMNYVEEGVNGRALNTNKVAEDFVNIIQDDIEAGYMDSFHQGALKLYSEKLSWSAWSKRFKTIMCNIF